MRFGWTPVTALLVLAVPAHAQLSARADATVTGRYVWHGISRAAGLLAQPSLAAGFRLHGLSLDGGAVLHYELDRVAPGELSEVGTGNGGLGETDFWGRAALDVGPARLQASVVRYTFQGDPARGGLGPALNTTEVYAALSTTTQYTRKSLEAWWDVDRVHGGFLRGSFDLPILGWPFPPFAFLFVDGEAGLYIGQHANFDHRGVTHAALGVGAELRAGHLGGIGWATFAGGLRTQLNLDDATRFSGVGKSRDVVVWLWSGVTVVLGRDAREVR